MRPSRRGHVRYAEGKGSIWRGDSRRPYQIYRGNRFHLKIYEDVVDVLKVFIGNEMGFIKFISINIYDIYCFRE